jgi:PST family polysaccharide transporter
MKQKCLMKIQKCENAVENIIVERFMSNTQKIFIKGVFYTAVAKYSGILISLIVTAILSRILTPDDFGIIAIAMVFIAFFSILSDIGIASAIVQKKELSRDDLSYIFSFTLYIAFVSTILFFFISVFIASYYDEPVLENICKLLSIHLFFSIANVVPNGLLRKNKEFKFLAWRTLIVQLIGGILAVLAVYQDFGIYSLLIAPIFSSIAIFIISYVKNRLPFSFKIQLVSLQKIFSYSIFQFLFNLINYFSRNLDNLLIGKYLGVNQLGFYEKSYRLMMLPLSNITHVFSSVIHPVFSDYQNNSVYITKMYLKIIRLLAFIGLPLSTFLFFDARELIFLLFGNQWEKSILVFQLLSLSVGFQMIVSSSGAVFQAVNATKFLFIDGLLSTLFTIVCLFVGLFVFKNLNSVALFISLSFIINFFKSFLILFRFVLKQKIALFIKELIFPAVLACLLGFILYFIDIKINTNLIISLSVKCFISILLMLGFIHFFKIYDLVALIRKYGGKKN